MLLNDDIGVDSLGPLPLTSPLDERVLRVGLQLPSRDRVTLLNVYALNPAVD